MKKRKKFIYFVHIPQDPSVGVWDINFAVEIKDWELSEIVDGIENGTEEFRKALSEFWGNWFDGKAQISFDTEER
jgi:uncharacterized protein YjbK